jgi:hypothetical protein
VLRSITPKRASRPFDASVPTDARNDILGCFGRSHRRALRQIEGSRLSSAARLSSTVKMSARHAEAERSIDLG